MIALAVGTEAGQRLDHPRGDLLAVLAAEQRQAHDQVDHHMRGQLAVGTTGPSAVLGHHLVDHVTRNIGGQDPHRDEILQLPFPQRVLAHDRHSSQPDQRSDATHPNNKINLSYVALPPALAGPQNDPRTKRHIGRDITRASQLPQLSHLFKGEIHTRLNDQASLEFHEQNHETLAEPLGRIWWWSATGSSP